MRNVLLLCFAVLVVGASPAAGAGPNPAVIAAFPTAGEARMLGDGIAWTDRPEQGMLRLRFSDGGAPWTLATFRAETPGNAVYVDAVASSASRVAVVFKEITEYDRSENSLRRAEVMTATPHDTARTVSSCRLDVLNGSGNTVNRVAVGGDDVHFQLPGCGMDDVQTRGYGTGQGDEATRLPQDGATLVDADGTRILVSLSDHTLAVVDRSGGAAGARLRREDLGQQPGWGAVQADGTLTAWHHGSRFGLVRVVPGGPVERLGSFERVPIFAVSDEARLVSPAPYSEVRAVVGGTERLVTRYAWFGPDDLQGSIAALSLRRCSGATTVLVDLRRLTRPLGRRRCPLTITRGPRVFGRRLSFGVGCTSYVSYDVCTGPAVARAVVRGRMRVVARGTVSVWGAAKLRLSPWVASISPGRRLHITVATRDTAGRREVRRAWVRLRGPS